MDTICMDDLKKEIKKQMDESRYEHTVGVMYTCAALAMRYQYSVERAMVAGLMHDCAKCLPNVKKLRLAEKNGLEITALEQKNPFMLHAKLGALLAEKKYGIDDAELLDAIRYHTTGRPAMTLLDKIVYIADYIEPGRDRAPHLEEIRHLAFVDLDAALFRILEDTLAYLERSPQDMDQMTQSTYEYYQERIRGRETTADERRNLWY